MGESPLPQAADPARLAHLAVPYLEHAGWLTGAVPADLDYLALVVPAAAASIDRLDQLAARLHFLFEYSAEASLSSPAIRDEAASARAVLEALEVELRQSAPLTTKDAFRDRGRAGARPHGAEG